MIDVRESEGRFLIVSEGTELSSFATEEAANVTAQIMNRVSLDVSLTGFTLTTTRED